ncbi:MAG: T9SS type A sorting domain-containing protein [Bacteroidetes bacterium]|nr:T9SS type A sorting domain-containing protein [Bacteroidota bacterium]
MKNYFLILCFLICCKGNAQRVGNYVANGSFEQSYTCLVVKNWMSIDSSNVWWAGAAGVCNGSVPFSNGSYQYPHSGQNHLITNFYYPSAIRGYPKNRLKSTLQAGKTYCVRFYVNLFDYDPYGMDGFAAYFGGSEIDTITHCNIPLTYITPQVKNPQGNIITDTLNWVAITGTFTANGTEKYLVLGNFLSDEDTDTLLINPAETWRGVGVDLYIDDVSCIEVDLPAYAGRDTTIFLNDSVYIGRENDFAIDTGCVWYKLPNTTAIDTISGFWVKPPIGTHTYVVRQELECSSLKWDTVVVTVKEKVDTTDINVNELRIENEKLRIYPNPTSGMLNVECEMLNGEAELQVITILGKVIKHSIVTTKHSQIDVSGLDNGIYFVNFKVEKYGNVTKKLIISK